MQIAGGALQTVKSAASVRAGAGWRPVRSRSLLAAYARAFDTIGATVAVTAVIAGYDALTGVVAVLAAVVLLFGWTLSGTYERTVSLDALHLFFRYVVGTLGAAGFLFLILVFLDISPAAIWPAFSAGCGVIGVAAAGRLALAAVARRWREADGFARMTVVIGTTIAAGRYIDQAIADGDTVVGVFAPGAEAIGTTFAGCPVIGSFAEVPGHPVLQHVDRVAVANFALPERGEPEAFEMLQRLRGFPYEVDLAIGIAGSPKLPVVVRPLAGGGALAKAVFDRLAAAALLILLAPVLGAIAIAIRLDTKGSLLFRQPRPGLGDATIGVFKFRTMHGIDLAGAIETAKFDPRITRIGRILRRYRLDELPQLLNVVIGEMSFVGPRPLPPQAHLDHGVMGDILKEHARRRAVKPGITGWAQVNGHEGPCRTAESLQRRIELDLYYINHWSFWLDLYILWRTIWVVFRRQEVAS